jgi:hypothetical protein
MMIIISQKMIIIKVQDILQLRESQAVLESIKESYFYGAFEAWKKNNGIAVYVPKETAAKIE